MRVIALEEAWAYQPILEANGVQAYQVRVLDALVEVGERRLRAMDEAGITLQVLSHATPAVEELDPAIGVPLARAANDAVAETVAAHPDRFAAFATLPMADPEAAASELDRAVNNLGHLGALINGGVLGGRFLDDEFFAPVFAAAQANDVPIYIHPRAPQPAIRNAYYAGMPDALAGRLSGAAWGWHVDLGTLVLRMVASGVFDRYPDLRVIIGHMGEGIPFYLDRADQQLAPVTQELRLPVKDYFSRNIYVTTSGVHSPAALLCTVLTLGIERILFSVDYPFVTNGQAREFLDHAPLSPADRVRLASGNAEHVLKLR